MPFLIAPIITAGLTALIGSAATAPILGIAGLTISGLVTGVVSLGLMVGAGVLFQKGKAGGRGGDFQPQLPTPGTVGAQSIGPRFHAVGQLRVGGVYIYRQVDSIVLLYGVVLNCGKIDSLIGHLVDDELQVTAGIDYPPFFTAADGKIQAPTQGKKYAQTLVTVPYQGGYTQIPGPTLPVGYYEFVNATDEGYVSRILRNRVGAGTGSGILFGSGAPEDVETFIWDDTKLARGLCCMYSEWYGQVRGLAANMGSFLTVYPNRYPQQSFIVRGEPVYDPRDVTQNFADKSTYRYSRVGVPDPGRNPALIWAYYWTHEDGGRLSYDDIDWDSVAEAADDCDRAVPAYGGGTEPFARCDMQWNTSEPRADVETKILAACDGIVYERNGKQAIWIAQDVTPTVRLTAADISRIKWNVVPGALDETNYMQGSYSEPRANYANLATIPITNDDSINEVGERPATVQFPAVTNFNQAYRLCHRVMRRRNPPMFLEITGGPRMIRAAGQFIIEVFAPEFGVSGKFFVADLVSVSETLQTATMNFVAVAGDAFEDVVSPDDPVAQSLAEGAGSSSAGAMLAPLDIPNSVTWDGTPLPYILAEAWTWQIINGATPVVGTSTIGTPTDETIQFFVQSRPVDPGTHLPLGDGSWSAATDGTVTWDNYTDQWTLQSPALEASHSYELRAWFRSNVTGRLSTVYSGKFVDIPAGP